MSIYKKMIKIYAVCVLPLVLGSPSFAGTWSTENGLAGMDSVHIYTPTTAPALAGKRALMINLHGCYQGNNDFKNNGGWEPTADQFGMVVAIPDVPGQGALFGSCWDYYGSSHSRTNKHNDNIINLAQTLMGRPNLNIDEDQVYVTGFSSGGGQVNVIVCLAPDIFAGGGAVAGPSVTTTSNDADPPFGFNPGSAANTCRSLAGSNASHFNTQIYNTTHGTSDSVIGFGYNAHNANVMRDVYNADNQGASVSVPSGGTEVVWSDAQGNERVSRISVSGMDHDWPSANGGGFGNFANNKIDYPNHVTQWFFDNNLRVTTGNVDSDSDGVNDNVDNCPNTPNPDQADDDNDGIGNPCDPENNLDPDQDGFNNDVDNCPNTYNPGQEDENGDGIGDACQDTGGNVCNEFNGSAQDHVSAGRAETYLYNTFARTIGSGESLGSMYVTTSTTVYESPAGYFSLTPCSGGGGNQLPTVNVTGSVDGSTVSMSCTENDSDGYITQIDSELLQNGSVVDSHSSLGSCSDNYSGLSAGTYRVRVTVTDDAGGSASAVTSDLVVGSSGGWECVNHTSWNTNHYNATPQRATATLIGFTWHYYAAGSGAELSATGPYSTTTVAETSEGYFEAGSCP